jgi:hypothetical protein
MSIVGKVRAYAQIAGGARRHRTDLARWLVRRPALAAAFGAYEAAVFVSDRLDNRTKALARMRASSLIGCPF